MGEIRIDYSRTLVRSKAKGVDQLKLKNLNEAAFNKFTFTHLLILINKINNPSKGEV